MNNPVDESGEGAGFGVETPMVTEKMIEAFGQAFWPCNAATHIDGERDNIRAALEAALSTDAEPVEWQRRAGDYGWQRVNDEDLPHYREKGAELRALYDRPPQPAPSVAVKALEWDHREQTDLLYERWEARALLGPYLIMKTRKGFEWYLDGHTGISTSENLDKAKAAAQSDYEGRIRSALSAQVQDVAEVSELMENGLDWFIEANTIDERTPDTMKKSGRLKFLSDGKPHYEGDMTPLEFMNTVLDGLKNSVIAAAPAAKLEEKP